MLHSTVLLRTLHHAQPGYAAVAEYVSALKHTTPSVVGIREGLWLKDQAFFTNAQFVDGLRALGPAGLVFDALVEKEQLAWLAELASKVCAWCGAVGDRGAGCG